MNWLDDLWQDWFAMKQFWRAIRNTRKQYPSKNLFERIEYACDALKYHNTAARVLYSCKNGPLEHGQDRT